jgi:hypothetical protein
MVTLVWNTWWNSLELHLAHRQDKMELHDIHTCRQYNCIYSTQYAFYTLQIWHYPHTIQDLPNTELHVVMF